jgi:branched-subunit amino acid ABC-type transport system permease component
MDILVLQIFNSLFYASVLFLIAAGLSLIFGVMRIVNMAHGALSTPSAPSSRRGWSGAQLRSVCPPDGCFS